MRHVLVIDNDLSFYRFLKEKLVQSGISDPLFYFAKDFVEAKIIKQAVKIDLVLVDVHLKKFNGTKVIDQVYNLLGKIPVIIFTDFNDEKTAIDCIEYGAEDYILKHSIQLKDLIKSIRFAATRHRKRVQEFSSVK